MEQCLRACAHSRDSPANGGPSRPTLSAGKLLVIFAPIVGLVASTAAFATAAWLIGWHRAEMLIAAEVAGAATGMLAMLLLYRQIRERQAAGRELQSVTARASDVIESAMDPIISIDAAQRIVVFNPAAEKVFGWPRDAVLGQPVDKLIPQRFHDRHRRHIEHFGRTGATTRRMGGHAVLTGLHANGKEFPIEASISQHSEAGQKRFTVILRDVSERVRVEEALRKSKDELRELGAAAHAAREQEMTRIARELHDELAQSLTALQMDAAWCVERAAGSELAMAGRLARMEALLKQTVAATRRIAADLRPLMLDDLGLVPAVEWLVDGFTQRNGIPCELAVNVGELELPGAHATAVFRIVQESLSNVAKHARASRVQVDIERNGTQVTLSIRDNGAGFSLSDPRKPNSYGLLGLRERASLLGGEASITSAPGEGTWVQIQLPITTPATPS